MSAAKPPAFLTLLSFEVGTAADTIRRAAALRLRREHDASLMEWRALALIEHLQPVTLRALTDYSHIDKAQISRVLSGLVERGLVERRAHDTDARSATLSLTREGVATTRDLVKAARAHDRAYRNAITEAEAAQLVVILGKLRARAAKLVVSEEALHDKQP